jgi:hypothetical protein
MEYYIVPRLSDGLGNKLFQYAAALGLSKKWNRPIKFIRSYIVPTNHGDSTNFLKLFPDIPVEDTIDNPMILSQTGNHFNYTAFSNEAPQNNVVIIDYRQNPLYFKDVSIEPSWGLNQLPALEGCWMIHFRQGDYNKLPQYSVDLVKYYRRCILALPDKARIHVFSDEPEKCTELLETVLDGKDLIVSWSTEKLDVNALYEMSCCTGGAITANSTFSWWGAYFARARALADNKTFQAFYPNSWGASLPNSAGIIPPWGEAVDIN